MVCYYVLDLPGYHGVRQYTVAHENAHIGTALTCSLQLDRHRHATNPLPSHSHIDVIGDPFSYLTLA